MRPQDTTITNQMEKFKAGSERTLLSANEANKLVDFRNMLLQARTIWPLKLAWSDSGPVFSLDPKFLSGSVAAPPTTPPPPSPSTALQWKGQYDPALDYVKGDIVIRTSQLEYASGTKVGMYIARKDAPAGSPEPTMFCTVYNDLDGSRYWDLMAPFAHQHLVQVNELGQRNTLTVYTGDRGTAAYLQIEKAAGSDGASKITLDINSTHDQQIQLNTVPICENGEERTRIFLDSNNSLPAGTT